MRIMKAWHIFLVFVVLAAAVCGLIFLGQYLESLKQQSEQSQWTPLPEQATSTPGSASSTTALSYPLPSATTTIPVFWQTYGDAELGYQIAYPPDLVATADGDALTLAFPTANYFRWPLQDNAKITITVAATCPSIEAPAALSQATTTFELNGYQFSRLEGHDVAAGNLYNEWAYETSGNGACYDIDLFDHGANGAGLYVDDQSLIAQYTAEHTADLDAVMNIWNTVAASFRLTTIATGTPETEASPAQ